MIKNKANKKAYPEDIRLSPVEAPRRRVIVAMSGGVDSSVAAALLKKDGYDVSGIFMRLNDCSKEVEERAGRVAKILNIPFRVLDLRKEFKKAVIEYFLKGYKKGITPNPCVVCNKEIKFKFLLKELSKMKADSAATGHYVKKIQNPKSKIQKLLIARDKNKDQSYFLWKLDQKQLKNILFPLENYTKERVRKIARELKLPIFSVPESQEVCFIKGDVNSFLDKNIKSKKGNIIEKPAFVFSRLRRGEGKFLGKHNGLPLYTIGQRKGIRLSGGPYYVVDKDIKKNILTISKNEKDLLKKELIVKDVNWVSGETPKLPLKVSVKIRYRHKAVPAVINRNLKSKVYNLRFGASQRAITPGQSAVFYSPRRRRGAQADGGPELLGGGIIC